jgi:hypothetical protein
MNHLFKILSAFLLIAVVNACSSNEHTKVQDSGSVEVVTNADDEKQHTEKQRGAAASVEVKTFLHNTADHSEGYGYDIVVDGKLYIHQPHIPAVAGNRSFKTDADAMKAGELVADKVRRNIMPPGLTIEELDSLGIK